MTAGGVEPQREVGHAAASWRRRPPPGVLDGDAPLGALEVHDHADDHDHEADQQENASGEIWSVRIMSHTARARRECA
jgi:hypothetical protein